MTNKQTLDIAKDKINKMVNVWWEKYSAKVGNAIVDTVVESHNGEHRNITGNTKTSIAAVVYSGFKPIKVFREGEEPVRGMLTKGEVFDGISFDGVKVRYTGRVATSGAIRYEEIIGKLKNMIPRNAKSIIVAGGTPYWSFIPFSKKSSVLMDIQAKAIRMV